MPSIAIETNRLTKFYDGRRVVDSLDLFIPCGTIFGLLGLSGAGKTTAIKLLLGLVQPDRGSAHLLGEPVDRLRGSTRRRIAYVAENHPFYGWMSVGTAICFTRSFYDRWNDGFVERALDHFAISRRQKVRRLTQGERSLFSLILSLAPEPELLLLDDPARGLDTSLRLNYLESLIQLSHNPGRTILISSNSLNDVERIADRVGIMVGGALRVDCPLDQFRSSLRRVMIETSELGSALPQMPGVIGCRYTGRFIEVDIVNYDDVHVQALSEFDARSIEVSELTLEEAFASYVRGSSLSYLSQRNGHEWQ